MNKTTRNSPLYQNQMIIILVEFPSYTNDHREREREREYTREDKQPRRHWEGRKRYFITDAMIFWRWRRRWDMREVVERRRRRRRRRGKSHGDGAFREILIPLLIRLRRGGGREAWGGERESCRGDHRSRERESRGERRKAEEELKLGAFEEKGSSVNSKNHWGYSCELKCLIRKG